MRPDELLKEKYELKKVLICMRDKMESFSKINYIMHLILKKKKRDEVISTKVNKSSDNKEKDATKEVVAINKD